MTIDAGLELDRWRVSTHLFKLLHTSARPRALATRSSQLFASTGDVSLHTLRHTALSRMIAMGIDDYTLMAISGHRSVRSLERHTHPTDARKLDALESFRLDGQNLGGTENVG